MTTSSLEDIKASATVHGEASGHAEAAWSSFVRTFLATLVAGLTLSAAFILVTNPYGNLPRTLFSSHQIVQGNQRFQYPAIARSGQYDSVLVGTSTSGILRPADLNAALGGRFANLAMDSAAAWEQTQIATLFRRVNGPGASLIVGIDSVWCDPDAGEVRITGRGFPVWMYDDNPWNDLPAMLNWSAMEFGFKRARAAVGLRKERIAPDGYKEFLPDEKLYDLRKAREKIGPYSRQEFSSAVPALDDADAAATPFPALAWLEDLLKLGWKRAAIVFMPVHIAAQPAPGTPRFAVERTCKSAIAEMGKRYRVPVVDFRIPSELTMDDLNYWDRLHYRVPVGTKVTGLLGRALKGAASEHHGPWSILNHPGSGW